MKKNMRETHHTLGAHGHYILGGNPFGRKIIERLSSYSSSYIKYSLHHILAPTII